MDELMDLLVKDESPSQISDKIKDILFAKSAEKIEAIRPDVAASIFDDDIDPDNEAPEDTFDGDYDVNDESDFSNEADLTDEVGEEE